MRVPAALVFVVLLLLQAAPLPAAANQRVFLPLAARDAPSTPTPLPVPTSTPRPTPTRVPAQPTYFVTIQSNPWGYVCLSDQFVVVAISLTDENALPISGRPVRFVYVYPGVRGVYEELDATTASDRNGGAAATFPVRSVVYNPSGGDIVRFQAEATRPDGAIFRSEILTLPLARC